jgi:transmembrane sensor
MLSKHDRAHADELLARTCCGEPALERAASEALAHWIADNAERSAYVRELRAVRQLVDTAAPALRARYAQPCPMPASRERTSLFAYVAGVCALLAVVIGTVWWLDPPLSRTHLATRIGERRTATLADGSRLTLNTASRLEAIIRLRSREVALITGEALFDVTFRALRPLRVIAGETHVEVVGTVFNVRRTDSGARVTVLAGKVAMRVGRQGEPVLLAQGEAAETAAGSMVVAPHAVNVDAAVSWRDGRLVFDDVPLAEALAEVQRYRRAPIVLADAAVGRLRLTGAFPTHDPDRLLRLLPEALPVEVHLLPDGTARVLTRVAARTALPGDQPFRPPMLLPENAR